MHPQPHDQPRCPVAEAVRDELPGSSEPNWVELGKLATEGEMAFAASMAQELAEDRKRS